MAAAHGDFIEYLDAVAASGPGRVFKRELLAVLDLHPGQVVLDVGCGPGTDLGAIRHRVGGDGAVLGIDADPGMCAEARRRFAGEPNVQVRQGDAHALPVESASVDRARAERVFMHLADPPAAMRELRRVLRASGVLALAEPDWDTLVIDHPDPTVSRAVTRYAATARVRHGGIGRQLARLTTEAGFRIRFVTARAVVHRDFASADAVWGLAETAAAAAAAGHLTADDARTWLAYLRENPFLGAITFFTVVAEPAR